MPWRNAILHSLAWAQNGSKIRPVKYNRLIFTSDHNSPGNNINTAYHRLAQQNGGQALGSRSLLAIGRFYQLTQGSMVKRVST